MFKPLRYDSGMVKTLQTKSDTTIKKGDALEFDSGYLDLADSSTSEVEFVALEDVTTDAGEHEDIMVLYVDGVEFEADTDDDTSQSDVGTKCDLADEETLDEDSSSDDVFRIIETVGADSDRKVRGYFILKTS